MSNFITTEKEFYTRYVRPFLAGHGDHERVENSVGSGTPDVNYAIEGVEGWIELKLCRGDSLHFEKYQLPWHVRRLKHNSRLYVMAYAPKSNMLYLYNSAYITSLPSTVRGRKVLVTPDPEWAEVSGLCHYNSTWTDVLASLT